MSNKERGKFMSLARRNNGTISERSVVKRPLLSGSSLENRQVSETLKPLLSFGGPEAGCLSKPCKPHTPQQFYQNSLKHIFAAMGLTKEQTNKCLEKIDSQMTTKQHKTIKNQTFLPPGATKQIKKLQKEIKGTLNHQVEAVAATRIQSLVRGFLLRKKFSTYTSESKKRLKMWTGSFSQVLLLETRYIEKLKVLQNSFLIPLQNNKLPGTENTVHYLNSNFERLLSSHEILCEELEALNNKSGFPFSSSLGSCLLENFTRFGPAYTSYAKNYRACMETLEHFSNNIPHFESFLAEVGGSTSAGYKKLKSLLQLPAEHLAALETKLNSIYLYYEDIQSDHVKLGQAITSMGFTSDSVQTQINQQALPASLSNIKKILAVEWQLEPMEKPLNLLAWSSRKLLKDGAMKVNGKRNMFIYLFSDLILITEKTTNNYRFIGIVELHHATIIQDSDRDFTVAVVTNQETTQFHNSSKSETSDWISRITKIVDNYNNHRVYGIPLTQLLLREKEADGIPRVLKQTLFWVAQRGCEIEGIFRVPGDSNVIAEYKVLYDCGLSKDIDFSVCATHDVAGLCKLYLRELPQPLIPFDSYDAVIKAEKEAEAKPDQIDIHLASVADVIGSVPKDRRKVLRFVLYFLKEFSANKASTKMTVANLAMVFSPNLVRPRVDTMDTAMESPMITRFITFLINNHENIWERATEGESLAAKEETDSVQQLVDSLLLKEDVCLDDLLKLSSRPSQYINLSALEEPNANSKTPKKMKHIAKKSPRVMLRTDKSDQSPGGSRYRKKKGGSSGLKLRRSKTDINVNQ